MSGNVKWLNAFIQENFNLTILLICILVGAENQNIYIRACVSNQSIDMVSTFTKKKRKCVSYQAAQSGITIMHGQLSTRSTKNKHPSKEQN